MSDNDMPDIAQVAEVYGGEHDGQKVAVVAADDTMVALFVDPAGKVHLQTKLDPRTLARVLQNIADLAELKADAWEDSTRGEQ